MVRPLWKLWSPGEKQWYSLCFPFPGIKNKKSLFSAFQSLPNQMAWDFLLGSQEVEPLPDSFTSHAPDIWVQRLEGKKRHRPLVAWERSDAKMGASDGPLSTCWEAKITWTLIFHIGLIVQDNPWAHISPHASAAQIKLLFIPTFSSRQCLLERRAEFGVGPAASQPSGKSPVCPLLPHVFWLIPDKEVGGPQRTRA